MQTGDTVDVDRGAVDDDRSAVVTVDDVACNRVARVSTEALAEGVAALERRALRRRVAALLDRLDAARKPVEARIAAALQCPFADVWREEAALRALLEPHEPALRALLGSADFAYYWTARRLIPLRQHLTAAELDRLRPVAVLNEVLERWLCGAAGAGLKQVRTMTCNASAIVADREHSDNMSKERFCAVSDECGLTAATEELGALAIHALVAPESAEVAAAQRWLVLEPWQHLARCTLVRIHGEKSMIAKALKRAWATIDELQNICFDEFKANAKKVLQVTNPYRKIIHERRTSWFERKLHFIEIDMTSGWTPSMERDPKVWMKTCVDVFETEGFAAALMADCSEGVRCKQNTLCMAHVADPTILACDAALQELNKIRTPADYKKWVQRKATRG